ncbi:hypothetical protein E4U55_003331 [Claviceps digitariae]|nr:hypothetical protein E4U55_003331 [Claviceps digitariae]
MCPRSFAESPQASSHDRQALQVLPDIIAKIDEDRAEQTSDDGEIPSPVASQPGNLAGDQYATLQLRSALGVDDIVQGDADDSRNSAMNAAVSAYETTTSGGHVTPFDDFPSRSKSYPQHHPTPPIGRFATLEQAARAPSPVGIESPTPSDNKRKQKQTADRLRRNRLSLVFFGKDIRADVLAADTIQRRQQQQQQDLGAECIITRDIALNHTCYHQPEAISCTSYSEREGDFSTKTEAVSTLPDNAAEHGKVPAVVANAECEAQREEQRRVLPVMQSSAEQQGSSNTG